MRYTAHKHPPPANPFLRQSLPVRIQLPDTMQPPAAPTFTVAETSAPPPPASETSAPPPARTGVTVNPGIDIVAEAIMAMEPGQVDRVERAAAQQAAVILQSIV